MITLRSTLRTAINAGTAMVSWPFKEFALACKAQGFTNYAQVLVRPEGKFPFVAFSNPTNDHSITVMLSKGVAEMINSGKLTPKALQTLRVVDGKNANGEERYYLSRDGITQLTVDQAIAIGEAYNAEVQKLSAKKLQELIG